VPQNERIVGLIPVIHKPDISMADAGRGNTHQHFRFLRPLHLERFYLQRASSFPQYRRTNFHNTFSWGLPKFQTQSEFGHFVFNSELRTLNS